MGIVLTKGVSDSTNMPAQIEPPLSALSMATEFLDAIDEDFCVLDRELKITYANAGAERILSARQPAKSRHDRQTLPAQRRPSRNAACGKRSCAESFVLRSRR